MASNRPGPLPQVVLDANLLYPFQLRNLLVQFGADSVFAPRWTTWIHEEWIGYPPEKCTLRESLKKC
jgi:hypothetical protein